MTHGLRATPRHAPGARFASGLLAVALVAAGAGWAADPGSLDDLLSTPISAAAGYEQTSAQAPASVTIVTAEDIQRHGIRTLAELLRLVRGFYLSNDRNYNYAGVRGFSRPTDYNDRILVQLDGHTLNDGVYGSVDLGPMLGIDFGAVERVEIVRGPASALHGAYAMFAVINIVMRAPASADGVTATAGAGSLGWLRASLLWGRTLGPDWGFLLNAHGVRSDGGDLDFPELASEESTGSIRGLDDERAWGAYGVIGNDWLRFRAFASAREKGIPTASYDTTPGDPRAETRDAAAFVDATAKRSLPHDVHVTARAYLHRYAYDGSYPGETLYTDSSDDHHWGVEASVRWVTHPNHVVTVGAEHEAFSRADYVAWTDDVLDLDVDVPYSATSIYLEDELQPSRHVSVILGARWDRYSTFGSGVRPRAALLVHPHADTTVKLLYGEAFRVPSIYEAFGGSPDQPSAFSGGLREERVRTTEVVLEQLIGRAFHLTASAFEDRIDDLIEHEDVEGGQPTYRNRGRAHTRGVEIEVQSRLDSGLWISGSFTRQRSHDPDTGDALSNSPESVAKIRASFPAGRFVVLAADAQYESARRTLQGGRTTGGTVVNVNGTTPVLFDHLRVELGATNLLDRTISHPGGPEHRQDVLVQDGRRVYLTLSWGF